MTGLILPRPQRSPCATPGLASGAFLIRHFCRDDGADIGSRDAQDFGVLVLEHEEGAIPVVPPDPGQGLGRAILKRDLVRLGCHTAPCVMLPRPAGRTSPCVML